MGSVGFECGLLCLPDGYAGEKFCNACWISHFLPRIRETGFSVYMCLCVKRLCHAMNRNALDSCSAETRHQ